MRWKPFLDLECRSFSRTWGLPVYRPFIPARLIVTAFAVLGWGVATVVVILKVAAPLKLVAFSLLYQNWTSLLLSLISLGILIGRHWLKYGELKEIQFLLGLPLSRSSIAYLKVMRLVGELAGLFLLVLPAVIPWGIGINWSLYATQMLLMFLIMLIGIQTGILLDSLVIRMSSYHTKVSKVSSYLLALLILTASVTVVPSGSYLLPSAIRGVATACLAALGLILVLTKATSWSIPICFESRDTKRGQSSRAHIEKSWGSFLWATARKDLLHYLREANQLLQMLLFSVVLLLIFTQVKDMGAMVTRVMLLGIPYSFAGIITVHLTGSDGVVLTFVRICRGTLRQYYGIRFFLSFVFVLAPSLLAYTILAAFFFRQGLSLPYFGALLFVCMTSVLLSLGISVIFRKDPNPLLPVRGTSALGEFLYWILGIGLILQMALWMPRPSVIPDIAVGFNALALGTIISAFALGVLGLYMVDGRET